MTTLPVLGPEGLKALGLVPITDIYEAGFSLAKPKQWNTQDGGGFTFTLLRDGKEVAYVENSGTGGGAWPQWGMTLKSSKAFVEEARVEFERLVSKMPTYTYSDMELTVSADLVFEEMLFAHDLCKKMAKGTPILVNPADKGRSYMRFKGVLDDALRAYIAKTPKLAHHVLLNDLVVTLGEKPSPKTPKVPSPSRRKLDELIAREEG